MNKIDLTTILHVLDEKTNPDGDYIHHQIGFVTKDGKYSVVERGRKTGLRYNLMTTGHIGIINDNSGDVRAVNTRLIVLFDGMKVVW